MTPEEQRNEWIDDIELESGRKIDADAKEWLRRNYRELSRMVSDYPALGVESTPAGRNLTESLNALANTALLWQRTIPHENGLSLGLEAIKRGATAASSHCWLC